MTLRKINTNLENVEGKNFKCIKKSKYIKSYNVKINLKTECVWSELYKGNIKVDQKSSLV